MIYVSKEQYEIIKETTNNVKICSRIESLPRWIPATKIATYFGYNNSAIWKACERFGGPYMWATEFENVHSTWNYTERPIRVDGHEYACAELYYQAHKPCHTDFSHKAQNERLTIMKKGMWQKFTNTPDSDNLLNLLVSTHPHTLVSIKDDVYWGFDAVLGGENQLANILMEIRSEIIHVMKCQLIYRWNIDGLWSSYNSFFVPPSWVLDMHKKHMTSEGSTATHTHCLTMHPHHKYLDLVLQHREPTNIKNSPGQFDITVFAKAFGYAESGYKTAFRLAKQQEIPPNFALLCRTRVQTPEIAEFIHMQSAKKCYINVVNLIGFAFDTESQPDYIYFIEGNRMQEFDEHLRNMFRLMFAAYALSDNKMLVLAQVGGRAFSTLFPGCTAEDCLPYLANHFYPCLHEVWTSLKTRPDIILLIGNPIPLHLNLLQSACPTASVLACGQFPAVVAQYVQLDPYTGNLSLHNFTDTPRDAKHTYQLSDALFVNAWDPHSVVGNGNSCDNSLDGHIGRCTDMAPMSFYPTNPNIRIIDANVVLANSNT